MLRAAERLQQILHTTAKEYDLVSFDPRGVRYSTPRISCFNGDLGTGKGWEGLSEIYGSIESSDQALGNIWTLAHARNKLCDPDGADSDAYHIKRHSSTAFVACDLEIGERSGELRERTATESLRVHRENQNGDAAALDTMPKHLIHTPGSEMLQYWVSLE
jgi:hypothetical protein